MTALVLVAASALLTSLAVPAGDARDAALDGRPSLLSFLPAGVDAGRFEVRIDRTNRTTGLRGAFWRTARGNAYLRAEPYDRSLVRREVGALGDRLRRDRARTRPDPEHPIDLERFAPLHTGRFYDRAEFQLPLDSYVADLLAPENVGLLAFGRAGACPRALDAHAAAVRRAVAALRPGFARAGARDRWQLGVVPLRAATRDTRHRAERACADSGTGAAPVGSADDAGGRATVTIERWAGGVAVRVTGSTGSYGRGSRELVVEVTPGPVGAPPARPRPAPDGGPVDTTAFLVAVNACRALPWEYTEFMAANSYRSPADPSYLGPNGFAESWACERDVPAGRRR